MADVRRVPLPLVGVAKEEETVLALNRLLLPLPLWPDEEGRDGEPPEDNDDEEEVRGNMDGSMPVWFCA